MKRVAKRTEEIEVEGGRHNFPTIGSRKIHVSNMLGTAEKPLVLTRGNAAAEAKRLAGLMELCRDGRSRRMGLKKRAAVIRAMERYLSAAEQKKAGCKA